MKQKKSKEVEIKNLCDLIIKGMQEKKAQDIVLLDMRKVPTAIVDYFIICTGTSDTQIDAIADSIEEEVYKNLKELPWHKEGKQNKEWILLDYVDVVAHVFKKSKREFYALEELWGDAQLQRFS
ncbi:ribosome silencing factor [Raineya orbicola]|jgi:ribosome-associated protein|uniref:Ribosomal silencing factor RsfS n=1 Tax=Raineya orbicola TaxID=2016530 RepID=A0A2N3I7B7_9BACT|nr:ribosome silencing factor [Raineya orbicola]PKQ66185.1 Iojap-like ribosome-associated protein [Raineya orbicola]